MRYSDIEKCCNSLKPKVPSLHVQSCLREVTALLRLNRWNRSLSRGCSCGSTSTLVPTLPISEVCSGGSREGPRGLGPPLFLDENEARRADNSFFEAGPPLSQGLDDRPPPPLIWRSGSATGISMLRTPSCLCATNPPFLHNRAWHSHHKRSCLVSQIEAYLQLMNGTEYLMKNYGNRGGCYTTRPRFP